MAVIVGRTEEEHTQTIPWINGIMTYSKISATLSTSFSRLHRKKHVVSHLILDSDVCNSLPVLCFANARQVALFKA